VITATRKNPTRGNTEPERERQRKETLQAQPSEENERRYTVRKFGTNSLKEGIV
jgi:hypothetical protein